MLVYVILNVDVSVIMSFLVWIHVHVCVTLPMVVGMWPMLWRLFVIYSTPRSAVAGL